MNKQEVIKSITTNNKYSTLQCQDTTKHHKNTCTKLSLATPELQNTQNLNKPKPKENTLSRSKKMDSLKNTSIYDMKGSKSALIKREFNDWMVGVYNPSHFLTIQLPENLKTKNWDISRDYLKQIMIAFEKSLLKRHWNQHHLPFVCFAENGASGEWHYHILLNQGKFTDEELQNAILETIIKQGLPFYTLQLEPIENNNECVHYYCIKEMKVYINGNFDSDRIILSADLFGLPYKTYHIEPKTTRG